MRKEKTVAIIFGGDSYEREISVITGVFCANLLKSEYDVFPLYLSENNEFYFTEKAFSLNTFKKPDFSDMKKMILGVGGAYSAGKRIKFYKKIDCVLNCCHGGEGEGGGLSALCEWYSLPLASPDSASSAVFMDKILTKYAVSSLGIPVLPYSAAKRGESHSDIMKKAEGVGYPVIVKPARLGSSIGIATAGAESIVSAAESAFGFDDNILIEPLLKEKEEAYCAVYSAHGKIISSEAVKAHGSGVFSFEEKYSVSKKKKREVFDGEIAEEIRLATEKLYSAFSLDGIVRADFFVCDGRVYFNELNTVPGSLAFGVFSERLYEHRLILKEIIETAVDKGMKKKVKNAPELLGKEDFIGAEACKM